MDKEEGMNVLPVTIGDGRKIREELSGGGVYGGGGEGINAEICHKAVYK